MLLAVPLVEAQSPASPASDGSTWYGQYFTNPYLGGAPALTREDASIDFDWGSGSPDPGIPADNFSVRWSRSVNFSGGAYRFYVTVDDGVRLWIDGNLVLDKWFDQAATTYSVDVNLTAGYHFIQMDYYEHWGVATARLWWEGPGTYPDWKGEYFDNPNLAGSPVLTRNDASINFNWGSGSPDPSIPADNFSVRWTKNVYFDQGTYLFRTVTDDGVRLWVDSYLVIDAWYEQPATEHTGQLYLTAGTHTVKMEYFELSGLAVAQLSWEPATPTGVWRGEYYTNRYLSGAPYLTRQDSNIDFNWGYGSPASGIPTDNFSVRWTANMSFSRTGTYTFYARSDDGVRLWVDGHLVIDAWWDQAATTHHGTFYLTSGLHEVKVEYYEHYGVASIKVWWTPGAPTYEVIVDELDPGFTWGGPLIWRHSAYIGYRGHMYWTRNSTYNVYNYAIWRPSLPAPGYYEVYAFIPHNYATTRRARYRIFHNGMRHDSIVNQYIYYDRWVSLGTYYFRADGSEFVFLSDNTREPYLSRYIGFDAIKFVPR